MKPFPEEPSFIPGEKGFEDVDENGRPYDLLSRKGVAQRLTDLLERVEQPLVIALDGGWGSGKSHFLKLWTGAHSKELGGNAQVIYFDAFEHDYLDDPLISLIGSLLKQSMQLNGHVNASFSATALSRIKSTGIRLAKPGLRIGLAVATAGASEMANAVWDAGLKSAEGAVGDAIEDFWKKEAGRTAAMQQFRDALTALTVPARDGDPPHKIVFILDELDRCRPDYALTMLEIVKHFFAVPNVHFVLGTNMVALENSVRSRYGADIRATEYLAKFVHLRMRFPTDRDHQGNGPWATYFDHLSRQVGIGPNSAQSLRDNLSIFSGSTQISLRDVQRLVSRLSLFPKSFESFWSAYVQLGTSALIMEVLAPLHFSELRAGTLTINRVLQLFPLAQENRSTQRKAEMMNHLWRRVTMTDPGEETKKATAGAFSHLSDDYTKDHFDRVLVELFDVFEITRS